MTYYDFLKSNSDCLSGLIRLGVIDSRVIFHLKFYDYYKSVHSDSYGYHPQRFSLSAVARRFCISRGTAYNIIEKMESDLLAR